MKGHTMSNLQYVLDEYFATDGFYLDRPSIEDGHTKACLANAMMSAIQNLRDDEGITDYDFASWAQRGGVAGTAYDYLNESCLSDCTCPKRVIEEPHYWEVHYKSATTGNVLVDLHWGKLTDMCMSAADLIDLAVAEWAYVAFADFGDGNAKPAMWVSMSYRSVSAA